MIWGDEKLRERLFNPNDPAHIDNADPSQINPASINIRLGDSFLLDISKQLISLGDEVTIEPVKLPEGIQMVIRSGEFMLANTMEYIRVPRDAAAFVQGRSSIGRIGLTVQNAGYVDPGFEGQITLELKNESGRDILLMPGYPVAQLVYMDCSDVARPYCGKYQGQTGATASRMHLDRFLEAE